MLGGKSGEGAYKVPGEKIVMLLTFVGNFLALSEIGAGIFIFY